MIIAFTDQRAADLGFKATRPPILLTEMARWVSGSCMSMGSQSLGGFSRAYLNSCFEVFQQGDFQRILSGRTWLCRSWPAQEPSVRTTRRASRSW